MYSAKTDQPKFTGIIPAHKPNGQCVTLINQKAEQINTLTSSQNQTDKVYHFAAYKAKQKGSTTFQSTKPNRPGIPLTSLLNQTDRVSYLPVYKTKQTGYT